MLRACTAFGFFWAIPTWPIRGYEELRRVYLTNAKTRLAMSVG